MIPGAIAGRGAVPLIVRGDIRAKEAGSELTGTISAPMTRFEWFLIALVAVVWFLAIVPSAGLFVWLLFEAVAIALLVVVGRVVRLGYAETHRPLVADLLREVISEHPRRAAV